jgi:hypothetical protein
MCAALLRRSAGLFGVFPEQKGYAHAVPSGVHVWQQYLLETVMKSHPHLLGITVAAAAAIFSGSAFAQAGQTVKIAFIDPLSGPFANVGQNILKSYQFVAEEFNKKNAAGVKFEMVAFDNKGSPQGRH